MSPPALVERVGPPVGTWLACTAIEDQLLTARHNSGGGAHDHRERLALYRARVFNSTPTRMARLRELERASLPADARLRTTKSD